MGGVLRKGLLPGLGLVLGLCGCGEQSPGDQNLLDTGSKIVRIQIDQSSGQVLIGTRDDKVKMIGLHQAVEVERSGKLRLDTTLGRPIECESSGGESSDLEITCNTDTAGGFSVQIRMAIQADHPGLLTFENRFENISGAPIAARKFFPFRLDGGLVIGEEPAALRILQNGTDEIIDYYANLLPGDTPLTDPEENPLFATHSSYSNGSALVFDTVSGSSMLAGFVEMDWATPLVSMATEAEQADPVDGRIPLDIVQAEARFPWVVEIPQGEVVSGGIALFVLGADSPFEALEAYADAIAEHTQISLPPRPASGWDSWYTSFAHSDIDEAFIERNADGLAEKFGPFGISSMQLDLGWQDAWGDWGPSPGFPSGMQAAATHIRSLGIAPELWMAPLSASTDSQIYQQHSDEWFNGKNMWGTVLMGSDMHPFDLTHPGVMDYVHELGERVRGWGYESVKMDFAYYTLFAEVDPDVHDTPVSLYRNAVGTFRQALGDSIYFINISMCFPNYGLVDGFRLGLDDWPCWEGGSACEGYVTAGGIGAQGLKPVVRMAARRYWMNGRIWWNHHDQIFFRELSLEESRAFVTFAGLSGGMIALGEDVDTLTAEQVNVFRRILPLTGHTARPMDLFEREFPEVWHLHLTDPAPADIVGLFHWGANRDWTVNPPAEREDGSPLTHTIGLAGLGLDPTGEFLVYEFWTGEFLGTVTGSLTIEMAPHTARVFKLVPSGTEPRFLATNRHILMGPEVVSALSWDPAGNRLAGNVETVTGFAQILVFWAPDGMNASSVAITGIDNVDWRLPGDGSVVVEFEGPDSQSHPLSVEFQP